MERDAGWRDVRGVQEAEGGVPIGLKDKVVTGAIVAYAWSMGFASAMMREMALSMVNLEHGKCGACKAPGIYSKVFFWQKRNRRCSRCDPLVDLFEGGPRVPASQAAKYRGR